MAAPSVYAYLGFCFSRDEFISILSESSLEGTLTSVARVTGLTAFNSETIKTMEDMIQAADTDLYKNKSTRSE